MRSVNISDKTLASLLHAVEIQIDILNDTIFDSFPFRASEIRELALLDDEVIESRLKEMHAEANRNFDMLEDMQKLYIELKSK